MALNLLDLQDLIQGKRDPIWVGEFPYEVAQLLGIRNPNAYLSKKSLDHIFVRHGDIKLYDLLHISQALKKGLIIQERDKPNTIIVSYQTELPQFRYLVAFKLAQGSTEIWCSSFYRSKPRQTLRVLRKGRVLKNHT